MVTNQTEFLCGVGKNVENRVAGGLDFQMRGVRSLVISQIVLFASTLGILKFSKEGEALIVILPVSSFFFLF